MTERGGGQMRRTVVEQRLSAGGPEEAQQGREPRGSLLQKAEWAEELAAEPGFRIEGGGRSTNRRVHKS